MTTDYSAETSPTAEEMAIAPNADEFDWDSNDMVMRTMFCTNHPHLRWTTKHLWSRTLHYTSWDIAPECACKLPMLRVIL